MAKASIHMYVCMNINQFKLKFCLAFLCLSHTVNSSINYVHSAHFLTVCCIYKSHTGYFPVDNSFLCFRFCLFFQVIFGSNQGARLMLSRDPYTKYYMHIYIHTCVQSIIYTYMYASYIALCTGTNKAAAKCLISAISICYFAYRIHMSAN